MRRSRPAGLAAFRLGSRRKRLLWLLLLAVAVGVYRQFRPPARPALLPMRPCGSQPGCFLGTVTNVVDGDTLEIGPVRVRLVLVDAPEWNTREGPAATAYLRTICPEGSPARLLQDRWQPQDPYGRTLGVVWCGASGSIEEPAGNDEPANARMIRSGHAKLYRRFCRESAFGGAPWAVELGCR